MSENDVEVIEICGEEKENILKGKKKKSDGENNNNIVNEEKEELTITGESFFSPPRKKLKQESIGFPTIPNDEAQPKLNESINEKDSKENGADNGITENCVGKKSTTPGFRKVPKSPGLSKEEKEKQRLERECLKLERQKELEEKKLVKEEEKKRKEEERLQKLAEKEKKEQEKKLEKEKREEERKEKERLREEEKKRKEDEKRKRDELRESERREKEAEREKREAEKRIEEEKKKQKEEAEKKKKEKAANQFKSFFTKKVGKKQVEKPAEVSRFANFQVTPNMTVAPCVRRKDFTKCQIDKSLEKENPDSTNYLEELSIKIVNKQLTSIVTRRKLRKKVEAKRKEECELHRKQESESKTVIINNKNLNKELEPKTKRRRSSLSSVLNKSNTEVVVIEDNDSNSCSSDDDEEDDENETSFVEEKKLMKTIYLRFEENTRPPYYGTWTKKSKNITGRRPFAQDTKIFNYDIDSDEEWIDEPGEDCSDNGEEDDEEAKETEEDQDGFFVPHGYLSDDEGVPDDDDSDNEENETTEKAPVSKEVADAKREQDKLKSKVDSFEVTFKKKLKPRKPICIGIKFTNNVDELDPILKDFLKISLYKSQGESEPTSTAGDGGGDVDDGDCSSKKNGVSETNDFGSVPLTVPEEAMVFLLKLVHGNSTSVRQMIAEFKTYWCQYVEINKLKDVRATISKKQLIKKIQNIASKGNNPQLGKLCYTVNTDILEKYGVPDLELASGLIYPVPEEDFLVSSSKEAISAAENVTEQSAVPKQVSVAVWNKEELMELE